jgi:hypothetical protein
MNFPGRLLSFSVVGCFVVLFGGCPTEPQHPSIRPTAAVTQITFAIDAAKNCTQTVGGVAYDYVPVKVGNSVSWAGPTPGVEVVFGPFDDYYSSSSTETSGATVGVTNVNHSYDSVTLGGVSCNNAYQMGLIMKP